MTSDELLPTKIETAILSYVKNRIYFLLKEERFFKEVDKISFKKTRSSFRIFYDRPNSGSLLDYWEQRDGKAFVKFPAVGNTPMPYAHTRDFDEALAKAFSSRMKDDPGSAKEGGPVLRTIQGGHAEK